MTTVAHNRIVVGVIHKLYQMFFNLSKPAPVLAEITIESIFPSHVLWLLSWFVS
ncbi:MAG: hypothetical protein CM15mP83_9020 [Flavobacteriaceae bacterium]|nr:MAG: hypothetical protein CM15mP83_9020 [Flavobacteriaceae bacterium]